MKAKINNNHLHVKKADAELLLEAIGKTCLWVNINVYIKDEEIIVKFKDKEKMNTCIEYINA